MRTTKKELLKLLELVSDNAEIILQVRGNKTTDYSEQSIEIEEHCCGSVVVIKDKLSV
jgi:hypothetical protein